MAAILGNSIYASDQLGIRLDTNGNAERPAPALERYERNAGRLTVHGSLRSPVKTDKIRIEVFANRECDRSGAGEGETPAGATDTQTDENGSVRFLVWTMLPPSWTQSAPEASFYLTATATDESADGATRTSGFSRCLKVSP